VVDARRMRDFHERRGEENQREDRRCAPPEREREARATANSRAHDLVGYGLARAYSRVGKPRPSAIVKACLGPNIPGPVGISSLEGQRGGKP
jgi:hypothetical protein